jgi:modulator of FtsH protease HflK
VAWNVPGGSGDKDKDPWGQRRKNVGGSDLDRIVENIQRKIAGVFGGGGNGGGAGAGGGGRSAGIGLIAIVVVALWLASGLYIVQPGERGVVLRFGARNDVTEPGLHWRLPYPIEKVEKVDVERVPIVEIGYRSGRSGAKTKVPKEALMLTEDENIIDIEFAVQYKVKDPTAYLFNVNDPEGTIAQATESAVREVVGKSTLDFALTEGREEVARDARVLLQQILDRYSTGIEIVAVETQKAQPPEEVKAAFDDAVKAREDQQRLKNEAEAYANDVIPRARGAAARMLQEAEGYKASTIARAEGDARRFGQVSKEYSKAPGVTRERLYLETMEQVLSNTTKIFVDQKGSNNVLYLPLDKMIPRADAASAVASPLTEAESAAGREPTNRGRTDVRRRGQP